MVVLNSSAATKSFVAGTIRAEGGDGAAPPVLHLHDAQGLVVVAPGRVESAGGLIMDSLGASWNTGQPISSEGTIDGGSSLQVMGAQIGGGGRYLGNVVGLATFGHANNPVNGSHFLSNGLNIAPSTGSDVALVLNDYGSSPQVFNLLVWGNAFVQMPPYWSPASSAPPNNTPLAGNLPDPSYGGGSMIVQASGVLTLAGSVPQFVFPGGIVLKAGKRIDTGGFRIDNGWTGTGRPFQGVFFDAPQIVSASDFISIVTSNLNWVNFGIFPQASVGVQQVVTASGGIALVDAGDTAPHLNSYTAITEAAATGKCVVCITNTNPVNMR